MDEFDGLSGSLLAAAQDVLEAVPHTSSCDADGETGRGRAGAGRGREVNQRTKYLDSD